MRAVPLVATSPIRHEEASPGYVIGVPCSEGTQIPTPNGQTGLPTGSNGGSGSSNNSMVQRIPNGASGSNNNNLQQQQQQAMDIQSYQPPWSSLIDYAHQQPTPDSIDTNSPRYQQLMSQVSLRKYSQVVVRTFDQLIIRIFS